MHISRECTVHQSKIHRSLRFMLAVKASFKPNNAYVVKFIVIRSGRFVLQEVTLDGGVIKTLPHGMVVHDDGCDQRVLELECRSSGRQPISLAKHRQRVGAVPVKIGCFIVSQDSWYYSPNNDLTIVQCRFCEVFETDGSSGGRRLHV